MNENKGAELVEKPQNGEKENKDNKTQWDLEDLVNTLKRLQADFENYKKRVEREQAEFALFASHNLLKQLLPIVDNFDLAFKNEQSNEEFKKGIELIYSMFQDLLKDNNVKIIETENKLFNPYFHETMMQASDEEKKDGYILETFQKGYMIGEKVLRHSKIKVNKIQKIQSKENN